MPGERLAVVHDRLHVGLSCREHAHVDELLAAGITHWIDHRSTRCDGAILQALPSVTYLWNPTKDDGGRKPLEWYVTSVGAAIAALEEPATSVLVSCARGEHRGPSIAYGILRARYECDPATALATLARAWPSGDPWYADDIERNLTAIDRQISRT